MKAGLSEAPPNLERNIYITVILIFSLLFGICNYTIIKNGVVTEAVISKIKWVGRGSRYYYSFMINGKTHNGSTTRLYASVGDTILVIYDSKHDQHRVILRTKNNHAAVEWLRPAMVVNNTPVEVRKKIADDALTELKRKHFIKIRQAD